MRSGFALISVMISLVLGSILLTTTFVMYNNIARSSRFIQRVSAADTSDVVLINRMQKDFFGIATMWNSESQTTDDDQTSSQTGDMENQYFYSLNNGQILDYVTFITTAAMSSYVLNSPEFVRVIYRLEAEKSAQNSFRLLRKEMQTVSKIVSNEDIREGAFSEVIGGIRSMKVYALLLL